jgi:hypothetical protein
MEAAYLRLLVLSPLASLLVCPLTSLHARPLPWGEGVPRAASSSAGAGRVRGLSRPTPAKVSRPKQSPTSRRRSQVGNATKFHQPGSDKSVGTVKSGFIGTPTVSCARTPSAARSAVPSFNNTRHRTPNPAVVSGSTNSHSNNTAAINGTRINRRFAPRSREP